MDDVGVGERVPAGFFCDGVPFDYRPLIGYRRQMGATVERRATDARDAVADGDRSQSDAVVERTASDARDAVGDGDRGQPGATGERKRFDAGDVVGDHQFGE